MRIIRGKDKNKKRWEIVAQLARGSKKILDCGCAWHPNPFFDFKKSKVTGIDVERMHQKNKYHKFVQSDLNTPMPFKKNTFDCVTAGEMIEHLYNPFLFLNECYRVLKPKGKLIITTPNKIWANFFQRLILRPNPYHFKEWTPASFRELLTAKGYEGGLYGKKFDIKSYRGFSVTIPFLRLCFTSKWFPLLHEEMVFECVKSSKK